ncbi:MAG: hypothetical protein JXA37_02210 [Chloroflexia bacterium]|nr:hypothetical protein [Chloroflexia bacterium]
MSGARRRLKPLRQAQQRRSVLPWYFDLSGNTLFLLIVLAASLLALLALAQTGRVVSLGARLKELQLEEEELLWQQEHVLQQIAEAADPAELEAWAKENGMVELDPADVLYLPAPKETFLRLEQPASMAQEP